MTLRYDRPADTPTGTLRDEYLLIGWPAGPGLHFRVAPDQIERQDFIRQLRDAVSLADDVPSLES